MLAGALLASVECVASSCSIIPLVYAILTGLSRARLGGPAVSGWHTSAAIISTFRLLAYVGVYCCCDSRSNDKKKNCALC